MNPPDYTIILNAVNWTTLFAAILSIGAGIMVLLVLIEGFYYIRSLVYGWEIDSYSDFAVDPDVSFWDRLSSAHDHSAYERGQSRHDY